MKKILNTLKNGDSRTKRTLVTALLSGAAAVACVIGAIIMQSMLMFFGAVMGVFICIALFQTLSVYEYKAGGATNYVAMSEQSEAGGKKSDEELLQDALAYAESEYGEVGDEEEITETLTADMNTDRSTNDNKDKKSNKKDKKGRKRKKIRFGKKSEADEVPEDNVFENVGTDATEHLEAEHEEKAVIRQASDEEIASYDKKKIRRTLHKYKVKRDHRMVLVDFCDGFNIKQTPAYIWVYKNEFHMLLIESEPRQIVLPLYSIKQIDYMKKVEVNSDTDYPAFHKETILTNMFREYLPDYSHSTLVTDTSAYKNLYGIAPGIYFTNRSASSLFDLLGVEFVVDDKVTTSNKVNYYFKDVYKSSILLRDNVIDANGYADRISKTLEDMTGAAISYNEFKETLNLMIKNKLITQEFAMHYMDLWDKNSK